MSLTVGSSCECGNEYLDSLTCGGMFLDTEELFVPEEGLCCIELVIYLFICFYRHLVTFTDNRMSAVCVLCFRDWSCHCNNRP